MKSQLKQQTHFPFYLSDIFKICLHKIQIQVYFSLCQKQVDFTRSCCVNLGLHSPQIYACSKLSGDGEIPSKSFVLSCTYSTNSHTVSVDLAHVCIGCSWDEGRPVEKITRTNNLPAVNQRPGQEVESCLGREKPRDKKCEAWKHEPIGT